MLRDWLTKKSLPAWVIPLLLLILTAVSFGLFLPKMGFYWDDWAKTLVNRLYGFSGYQDYYAYDRPLSGWTHILFLSIFGDKPIYWHGLMLVLRWLSAVNLWWLLRLVWPAAPTRAAVTAAIFAVLPVFEQQAAAVTFHQQWLQYALVTFSLAAMAKAVRSPQRRALWVLLALVGMVLELTVTEYFIGIELLRLPLLFLLCRGEDEKGRKYFWRVLRRFAPYLAVICVYVVYRLFFLQLAEADPFAGAFLSQLKEGPVGALKSLWDRGWRDVMYLVVFYWGKLLPLDHLTRLLTAGDKLSWLAGGAAGALTIAAVCWQKEADKHQDGFNGRFGALLLAGAAILLGLAPGWYIGLNILTDEHSDRIALPAMLGLSLLIAVLLEWLTPNRLKWSLLTAVVVFFSVAGNIRVTNSFRWDWHEQQDYFWQMHWRMPALQPGTALVAYREPFPFSALFATSSAVNLLYPQEFGVKPLGYWMYTVESRYHSGNIPQPFEVQYSTRFRSLNFKGGTPATVMIYWDPAQTNCVWVLGAQDQNDPGIPQLMRQTLQSSDLNRIGRQVTPGYPPRDLFGAEPPQQEWCYFFEKASLAVQFGEWQQAEDLLRQARDAGYSPAENAANIGHEWLPFLRTLIHEEQWNEAKDLTLEIAAADRRYEQYVCQVWQEDRKVSPAERLEVEKELSSRLSCTIQE